MQWRRCGMIKETDKYYICLFFSCYYTIGRWKKNFAYCNGFCEYIFKFELWKLECSKIYLFILAYYRSKENGIFY